MQTEMGTIFFWFIAVFVFFVDLHYSEQAREADFYYFPVYRGHRGSVLCLLFVGNVLVSSGRDNTIRCANHSKWVGTKLFPAGFIFTLSI